MVVIAVVVVVVFWARFSYRLVKGLDVEVEEECIEWKYFENFEEDIGQYKEPYRTEWMIWDDKLKFAGSIDMTYINKDGTIDIYDWKRSVGIKKENRYQNALTKCIKHIPDSNYWHYCLHSFNFFNHRNILGN